MRSQSASFHGYRFPPDIISHAVWLYHRFCLSLRDVEDLLAQRGVTVTYETIRQWCQRFGPVYARRLRRRRGRMGDTWRAGRLAAPTPPDGCGTALPVILADRRRPATSMQRPVERPPAPPADNATPIEPSGGVAVQSNPFFGHQRGDAPCHCRPVAAAPPTEKCSALSPLNASSRRSTSGTRPTSSADPEPEIFRGRAPPCKDAPEPLC